MQVQPLRVMESQQGNRLATINTIKLIEEFGCWRSRVYDRHFKTRL